MKVQKKADKLIIILAMMFSTLVFTGVETFAADTISTAPTAVPAAQTATSDKQLPPTDAKKPAAIPQKNAYALEHMEKTGFKYAIFKFLLAMLGVLISCLAIFGGLKFYKKIVLKSDLKHTEIDYDKTLESPKNFKEAINLFLHKTNKR